MKFNETVYPQPLPLRHVHISDSASGEQLPLISTVPSAGERFGWDFLLGTAMKEATYVVVIDSLADGAGNLMSDSPVPESFTGSVLPDTARPLITEQIV